jgi:hypothetical protein
MSHDIITYGESICVTLLALFLNTLPIADDGLLILKHVALLNKKNVVVLDEY